MKVSVVRILPMNKIKEFNGASIEDVQNEFFLKELPSRFDGNGGLGGGKYCYLKQSMNAPSGLTFVLFQYDNKIIAKARLMEQVKFDNPLHGKYHGAYYFQPESIATFTPINNDDINRLFNVNIKFSNIMHTLDVEYLIKFICHQSNIQKVDMDKLIYTAGLPCKPKISENKA